MLHEEFFEHFEILVTNEVISEMLQSSCQKAAMREIGSGRTGFYRVKRGPVESCREIKALVSMRLPLLQ